MAQQTKQHAQRLTQSYDDNVFINCPFDEGYKPVFDAVVFAIHDCGFIARCSLEAIGSERTRLEKLLDIIAECKYGIHDISRIQTGSSGLPRFNMPFECGLFWGCRRYGAPPHNEKRLLVLDENRYQYQASMSDIAGQDIAVHKGSPKEAMNQVRAWLTSNSGRTDIPGGRAIWDHYRLFKKELPSLLQAAQIAPSEIRKFEYFGTYVGLAIEWLKASEANVAPNPL
jgi:hypothetical protein